MAAAANGWIDLRSDTVTKPSQAMRRAMAAAEVGDDWFGDDPTVNGLQRRTAELTGREAALFLPTGVMCNQIALHALARSGRLVVCEEAAHVCGHEVSSSAVMSGTAFRRLRGETLGLLTAAQVAEALEPDPADVAVVDLVAIENTHQIAGGTVMPAAGVAAIAKACAARGVPLYLDGARIFNACAATGADVAEYAAVPAAMMFCLSKGLGAPVGSMLVGDAEFIRDARRLRVLFGAGWRQAGILAAAGLVALAEGPSRLPEDHANARRLAEGVADLLPGTVDLAAVQTNIVFVDVKDTGHSLAEWVSQLASEGLRVTIVAGRIRMVTHLDFASEQVPAALAAWHRAVTAFS